MPFTIKSCLVQLFNNAFHTYKYRNIKGVYIFLLLFFCSCYFNKLHGLHIKTLDCNVHKSAYSNRKRKSRLLS